MKVSPIKNEQYTPYPPPEPLSTYNSNNPGEMGSATPPPASAPASSSRKPKGRKRSQVEADTPDPGESGAGSGSGHIDPDEPKYKVARAISSCTRCRSRKQKCDGKLPACSACERAGLECIGFDAVSKTNVSRK